MMTRRALVLPAIIVGIAGIAGVARLSPRAAQRPSAPAPASGAENASPRQRTSLDVGWKFALGSAADVGRDFGFGAGEAWSKITSWVGPARPGFNDVEWRDLDVPHDWAVELPFAREPRSDELLSHGFKPVGRAFPDRSIGWYRKHFTIPEGGEPLRSSIEFDGVFRDCYVWLNGALLGHHEGGYAPFGFDATDLLREGDNVLTVRVDATQAEGWFYEGAGIYRHVWLVRTDVVHFPKWGIYVVPQVSGDNGAVAVTASVANDSERPEAVVLESQVLDASGKTVATAVEPAVQLAPWETREIKQQLAVTAPSLWSIERPSLYRVVSSLRVGPRLADRAVTRAGFRTLHFDPDQGFFLNGRRVQIKGMCNHQDHAGIGAAVPDRLARYRIERLKEMGVNAYRTSHNPPAPELLDACDDLGMLVLDETRLFSSSDLSLEQLRAMVRRDRNHPSVILWSIGNEEPEQATARGHRVAATMMRAVKQLDATRPVTYASNSGAYAGINELMDVRGFNYNLSEVDRYHKEHPGQPLIGSEVASTVSTRGEYVDDAQKGYLSAYDKHKPAWGELAAEWLTFFAARPWLAGGFVWTGFDYRGEPTPYQWPCISSHFGILDTCGFPKDLFWYYKSWWTDEPVLHLLPHWNWPGRDGQPIDVWAFTNLDEVRLSLNGRDLGARKVERFGHAEWQVAYEPGRLEAVGLRAGREVTRAAVETTTAPARVTLAADRPEITAAPGDLAIVRVAAVDDRGREVPVAANDVSFEVGGPGRIIGVGNGDPSSHEADVFVASPIVQRITAWHAAPLSAVPGQVLTITQLQLLSNRAVSVEVDGNQAPANSLYAFWASFDASPRLVGAAGTTLTIGQIADAGQVYLNSKPVGSTDNRDRAHSFDVSRQLATGPNDLVVIVRNKTRRGGLGRGVSLSRPGPQPPPHRKLFNGLAQVLLQTTGAAGEITLRATADGLTPASLTVRAR